MKKREKKHDKTREEIFEQAVKKYTPRIYKMIYNMTNNYEITEDLTQDVFMNAWRGFKSFRGDSSIYTWLYRISLNTVFKYRRQNARMEKIVSIDAIAPPETKNSPEKTMVNKDDRQIVKQMLYSLPTKHQEILILRYYEDFDYLQISQTLGVPIGTVRSRIHRALFKLEELVRGKR
jgi:RNA polymerase sigma-70 factor, ECF subfamily